MKQDAACRTSEAETSRVIGAGTLSSLSRVKARACVNNNQQKNSSDSSSSSTAERKSGIRSKLTDLLSSAVSSSSSSQLAERVSSSSNKRTTSATMIAENANHSLVCSLLMPDGVTVRKPPPLGIASGDPVGTHILRKRATSMRTEKFSCSGLNLSLHRRAAANNSMLSWQRSFRSTPRGNPSSFGSTSWTSASSSYSPRARGSSFMGRPVETLPRLMAFSPSLSKALNQRAYLIPAPSPLDSEETASIAPDAVSASTEVASEAASPAADAAPRSHAAAEACPAAGPASLQVGNIPLFGSGAQIGPALDSKGEETANVPGIARVSRNPASVAGPSEVIVETGQEEGRDQEGLRSPNGADSRVVHVDETLIASYCAASSPSRVSFSSSFDLSSAVSVVRRKAGSSDSGKIVKANQLRYTDLDHPADISSDTTVTAASSGSSSTRTESSSEDHATSSKNAEIYGSTNSVRSRARRRMMEGEAMGDVLPDGTQFPVPCPDEAAFGEGAGAHAPYSSDFRVCPSASSFATTEKTSAASIASPSDDASPMVAQFETRHSPEGLQKKQRHQPAVSPAQLYQMGIRKFTEGKTLEAIEVLEHYLRDAVAQKRRQRMAEKSKSAANQPSALRVSTEESSGEQRTRDNCVFSPVSAGESTSTLATAAATVKKDQTNRNHEKAFSFRDSIAGGAAKEEVTKAEAPEGQAACPSVSVDGVVSPRSSPLVVTTAGSDKHVFAEGLDSAPAGETLDSSLPKEAGVLQVTDEETEQRQSLQRAPLQVQDDQRTEEDKSTCKYDGTADKTHAKEDIAVKRKEELFGPALSRTDATVSLTLRSGLQPQCEGSDLEGKTTDKGATAEKNSSSHVGSSRTVRHTTCGASSQTAAVRAAVDETNTVAAGGAPLDGAGADAASEEVEGQQVCFSAGSMTKASTSSPHAASWVPLNSSRGQAEGADRMKECTDAESKTTGDVNGDPEMFKAQEAVPVQKLYGVVLGRRMQIDRRAKDVIAGWGTPQYLHLEKLLGHLLFEKGDYPEAIRHYWRCIDLRPDDSQLYTNLGLAYCESPSRDDSKDTISSVQASLVLRTSKKLRHATVCGLLMASWQVGATEEATASFEQALVYNDRNTVAMSVLAMLLMDKFEDAEEELLQKEAENAGEEGLDRDETQRLTRLRKGTERCVTLLKRCLEVEGDNMLSVLHLAQVHMYREEWDEAESIFKALLQDNSDDTHLLNNLGQIAMNKGAAEESLQLFERVLQINPQDEVAHMHMCEALCTMQHLGRALQHFCLCCEASPDSVSLHATCGLPLCEAGKEKEVVAAYTNFIKKHPESVAARTFKRSLGSSSVQVGFLESSQIIMFIVLPILLLIILLVGFTHLISYWSSPTNDRELPPSWESIYYSSAPDKSAQL